MSYFIATTTTTPARNPNCFHLDIHDEHGTLIFSNGESAAASTLFERLHEFSADVVADEHQALRYEYRELIDEYANTGQDQDERFEDQLARTYIELTESLLEMIAAAQPQWQISAHAKHI